ncbi:MAG: hypothetical protein ACKVTZ_18550 [Bacteroidia bacterium]
MRTFGSFTFEQVEDLFQIEKEDSLPLLTEWLSATYLVDDFEKHALTRLKTHLLKQVLAWNEDELKMFFIGPLIELCEVETKDFKAFTQRFLSATINSIEVNGRVDFMIAKGKRTAKAPYFCIHEYKQEIDNEGEPLGQVLIAMLAAQTLNENKFPILGAYIVGRNWFFIVLDDKKYAVSRLYDATENDIFDIFAILQKSKEIIQRFI